MHSQKEAKVGLAERLSWMHLKRPSDCFSAVSASSVPPLGQPLSPADPGHADESPISTEASHIYKWKQANNGVVREKMSRQRGAHRCWGGCWGFIVARPEGTGGGGWCCAFLDLIWDRMEKCPNEGAGGQARVASSESVWTGARRSSQEQRFGRRRGSVCYYLPGFCNSQLEILPLPPPKVRASLIHFLQYTGMGQMKSSKWVLVLCVQVKW